MIFWFVYEFLIAPILFIKKTIFPSTNFFALLLENQSTIFVCVFLWVSYPVQLIYGIDPSTNIIDLVTVTLLLYFCCQYFISYSKIAVRFHICILQWSCLSRKKKSCWYFERNCTKPKFALNLGRIWHLYYFECSNPWIWCILFFGFF